MPQQADGQHGSENTGASPMIWENDGSDHSEIAGDTICIECADDAANTEEDPHPAEVPGWVLVPAGELFCNYCGQQPGVQPGRGQTNGPSGGNRVEHPAPRSAPVPGPAKVIRIQDHGSRAKRLMPNR